MENQKIKIYIAGKVSGEDPKACAAKFAAAENILKERGYEVVNPIKVVGDFTADWQTAMRKCISALMACDGIYLLPDWQGSTGATLECALSVAMGIIVYDTQNPFFE